MLFKGFIVLGFSIFVFANQFLNRYDGRVWIDEHCVANR